MFGFGAVWAVSLPACCRPSQQHRREQIMFAWSGDAVMMLLLALQPFTPCTRVHLPCSTLGTHTLLCHPLYAGAGGSVVYILSFVASLWLSVPCGWLSRRLLQCVMINVCFLLVLHSK